MVGFWWLSLTEGQKKKALSDHPEFAERYSEQTCKNYGSVCNQIPTFKRLNVGICTDEELFISEFLPCV